MLVKNIILVLLNETIFKFCIKNKKKKNLKN